MRERFCTAHLVTGAHTPDLCIWKMETGISNLKMLMEDCLHDRGHGIAIHSILHTCLPWQSCRMWKAITNAHV